jgi:pyridoxine kinase
LTDVRIIDVPSLRNALKILHDQYHVPYVVISSIPLRPWLLDTLPVESRPQDLEHDAGTDYLLAIASSASDASSATPQSPSAVYTRYVRCLPGYFSGVGDLFSALVLAHFHATHTNVQKGESPIAHAVSQALAKTHAILSLTHEYASALPEEDRLPTDEELDAKEPQRKIRRMKGRELRLIQGQDILRGAVSLDWRKMDLWAGFWDTQ